MKNPCKILWSLFFSFVGIFASETELQNFVPKPILKKSSKYLSLDEMNKRDELIQAKNQLNQAIQDYQNSLAEADKLGSVPDKIRAKLAAGNNLFDNLLPATRQKIFREKK